MAISPRDSDELRLALANTQDGSDPSYQGADTITVNVAASEPRSIGRHTILRRLGQGGMGVVYAAYDQELDRKVAVKLLHTGAGDTLGRQRLVREAQALARLSHPNVVTIYQVAESEGRVYIAMEFVDGTNLAAWQTEDRPWEDVLRMYLQAGRGLHAAHEAGLVHRDFKPDNIPFVPSPFAEFPAPGFAGGNGDGTAVGGRRLGAAVVSGVDLLP